MAFPGYKLVDLMEGRSGVPERKSVFIKGSYEKKGRITIVRLKAVAGMSGERLAQAKASFETETKAVKTLVAVLALEAADLNKPQKKAFSKIFESALLKYGNFEIASSAEVAKYDPDAIQKPVNAPGDECAVIIGQQMGVDRVIASSSIKISRNMYILSATMTNVKDEAMIKTETVKHSGNLQTLDKALDQLARKLTGYSETGAVEFVTSDGAPTGAITGGVERITPKVSGNRRSNVAALILTSIPSKIQRISRRHAGRNHALSEL